MLGFISNEPQLKELYLFISGGLIKMVAKLTQGFWAKTARIILRNRIMILLLVIGMTVFLGFQWDKMRFSNSQANLLPDDHPVNLE